MNVTIKLAKRLHAHKRENRKLRRKVIKLTRHVTIAQSHIAMATAYITDLEAQIELRK